MSSCPISLPPASIRYSLCAAAVALACAGSASAQGTYVSASVFGDVVRVSHAQSAGLVEPFGGGEAVGFALRAGTPLGTAWGVEVEYARPGEIENDVSPRALSFVETSLTVTTPADVPGVSVLFPDLVAPTILPSSIRTAARQTTLSTALWVHQPLTARFTMVYLGGMAFYRSEHEYEYQVTFPRLPPLPGPVPVLPSLTSFRSESIAYGVRPLVGVESRIGMTDHAHLSAGVRLQASSGVWLIRPSIGLGWMF